MIKVTSASNKTDFYLIDKNIHITLDNGNTYIVSNTIDEIQSRIINVESATIHTAIVKKQNDEKEEVVK